MEVIGYNVSPQNLWDDITNVRPYNGRTSEKYLEEVLGPNLSNIKNIKEPFEYALKIVNSQNQESVFQALGALPQWKAAKKIVEGTGEVIGWDLETIGDVANQVSKYDGYASITEYAIGSYKYENGILKNSNVTSFALGIDSKQKLALYDLIDRFKKDGWDSLSQPEQVTLDRLSMIGDSKKTFYDIFEEKYDTILGNKGYWTVKGLGQSSMDPSAMRQGADRLHHLYYNKNAKPEEIIPLLTSKIQEAAYTDGKVLTGANNIFDFSTLDETSKRLGINNGMDFKAMYNNTVDLTNAVRTMPSVKGVSVLTFSEQLHGNVPFDTDRAASIDSMMQSLGMDRVQLHTGGEDVINQVDILTTKYYSQNKSFIDSFIDMTEGGVETYNVDFDKNLFLINRGHIDKTKADMAVIDGKPTTQSYSMGNDYWQVNTSRTGMVEIIDGKTGAKSDKFILNLTNAYDSDVDIYKEFDSADDAIKFLRNNTTWVSKSSLTKEQIQEQHFTSMLDKGRREFDKLLDPLAIRKKDDVIEYGFDGLKKNLAIMDQLGPMKKTDAKYIMSKIQALDDSPFDSIYQAQAFAGMYEKLSEERKVLDYIVNEIDNTLGNASPFTKTTALRKAYDSTNEYLTSQFIAYAPQQTYYSLNDVFGIDVKVGDSIHRINAQSVSTATPGINSIFRGKSAVEAESIIKGLGERGLLTANQVESLNHSIYLSFQPNAGINNFVDDVAKQLVGITDRFNTSSNPIEDFRHILSTEPNSVIAAKNLQSIANNLQAGAVSKFKVGEDGKRFFSMSTLFDRKSVNEAIQERIKNAITDVPSIDLHTGSAVDDMINKLASKLNLNDSEKSLLGDMFTKHKLNSKGQEVYNFYAISSPDNIKKGLQSFVVMPENNPNAFVVLTNSKHSNNVMDILSTIGDDVDYSTMTEALDGHASVLELHGLKTTNLGTPLDKDIASIFGRNEATLITANQGKNYEKFLIPVFEQYKDKETGKIKASIRTGGEDLLSSYRLNGRRIVESVLKGDFDKATKLMRRTQNAKFKDLSAPSSYRGYIDEFGKTVRIANYHPADFLHAYEMNIDGVKSLFAEMATQEVDTDYNPIQRMLYAFNEQVQIVNPKDLRTAQGVANYRTIVESNQFNEFFAKNLLRDINLDSSMGSLKNVPLDMGGYSSEAFGNKNILQLMQDIVASDKSNSIYDISVKEELGRLSKTMESINQLLPESAMKHNLISFIKPGAFADAAGLFSTMRPTYFQQNRSMYFNVEDIDPSILDDKYTSLFPSSMTLTEHTIRDTIEIKTPNGDPFDAQHRAITTRFKQIGDADLQIKYLDTRNELSKLASEWGVTEKELGKALDYMEQEMSSVYEGKWFLDPTLGNSKFFTQADAKKIEFNIDGINQNRTKEILLDLFERDAVLDSNTIIAQTKNGMPIFHTGPMGKLSVENLNELLSEGRTYLIPDAASVRDVKLMIGPEKATAHTISMKGFMEYTGLGEDKASKVAHNLFGHIFDGATVAGNIANLKHNGNMAAYSVWNAIKLEYQREGQTELLINTIRNNKDLNRYFADWNLEEINNMLVVDNTNAKYLDDAIIELEKVIRKTAALEEGKDTISTRIARVLDENKTFDLSSVELQRTHMNEHLSNQFKMDQRIEQGIRLRNHEYLTVDDAIDGILDGVNGQIINGKGYSWDDIYLDQTRAYAMSSDIGMSKGFLSDDLGAIRHISDIFSTEKLSGVRNYNAGILSNRTNVEGVIEALRYYTNPDEFVKGNIITVTLKDFIDNDNIPRSGVSVEELQDFIFKVDGKPSAWLSKLAEKQNVDLNEKSLNIFFDFGQEVTTNINGKKYTYTGAMLPVQNVITNLDDEQFFVNSQKNITRFINEVIEAAKNPEKSKSMKSILSSLVYKMGKELAIMKKDSDIYKAGGRYSLPNAGQFLAQDETPAIIDDMITDEMNELRATKKQYEQALRNNDLSVIEELQKTNERINKNLDELANSIKDGNLSEFTALKNSNLRAASIIEIDGKKYYNNAVALGEQGFKKLGFDFGHAGMDLINDFELRGNANYTSNIPGIERFNITSDDITKIQDKINKLNIDGIHIDDADLQSTGLMRTLNAQIQDKYGISNNVVSIKDLNRAIVDNSRKGRRNRSELRSIFDTFNDVSKRYVSEIGLFGEHLRYPSFGGQPAVNVLLDNTIEGEQIRYLNPVFSIHTNVDFDGDTGFLHIKLDGNSIGKFNVTDGLDGLHKSYLSGVTKGNDLIAKLIADGEAFKVDDLNDMTGQLANKLKAFKEDEYWDAVETWANRNRDKINITGSIRDIEDEAIIYAMNHSPEMRTAYSKAGFNTLTDSDIIRASLIPAIRKQNIGIISTPNFNLRDTLVSFVENTNLTEEERQKVSIILHDMTNMSTKDRGLLSITEQKGIDVKHLIDSYNISETPKWSLGLNQLFNIQNTSDIQKAAGITNMVKASNHVLFNASDDEVQNIVKRIMETSYEDYDILISKEADKKVAKKLLYEKWYRGLYEFSNMDGAAAAFHAGIKTGSLDDYLRNVINFANEGDYKVPYGTIQNTFQEIFEEAYSDQHMIFNKNTVYLKAGTIDSVADTGYVFSRTNNGIAYFDEVSLSYTDRGKYLTKVNKDSLKFDASSAKDGDRIRTMNRKASEFFDDININIRNLREDPDLMISPLRKTKTLNALNDIVLGGKLNDFLQMSGDKKRIFNTDIYNDILRIFGNSDSANALNVQNTINEIRKTYESVSTPYSKNFSSLIRDLNQDIVNNPENYANHSQFTSYDALVKQRVATALGGESIFDRAHERRLRIGDDFNFEKFNESLDFLNGELYDIMGEKNNLIESYEAIKRNMANIPDEYKQPLQDILDSQAATVDSVIKGLEAKNLNTIKEAENKIYKLFKSSAQMDAFFNWNKKASSDTLVGFGEYINTAFGQLDEAEIGKIKKIANSYSDEALSKMPALQSHAIRQTRNALENYKPDLQTIKINTRIYGNVSDEIKGIIDTNTGTLNRTLNKVNVDKAAQEIHKQMKKSTLSGTFFDNAKNLAKKHLTPKTVGIAAASLAAIGVVNNMLHNQRTQSPLTPARKPGGNDGVDASPEAAPVQQQQAPNSPQRRIVYHDNGKGFNFKVSARTSNYINDSNNAKLIGMSGGGQASVHSHSDMSGVTDNWLANKFAELS